MDIASFSGVTGFLWDIFKNVLSNRVDESIFGPSRTVAAPEHEHFSEEESEEKSESSRRFITFDARYDIEKFVGFVQDPIVHLLIEECPSTHYNLPAYVLESQKTGEWFVFSRGRLALQGTGGGHQNMESVVSILRSKETGIVGWVIASSEMDRLEGGEATWPSIKPSLIPLLSYSSDDSVWLGIKRQFNQHLSQATP